MSNQERRLMRRMAGRGGHGVSPGGIYLPQGAYSPQDEQDARRDRLAERLLEIGLEETRIGDFADCHKREPVVKEGGEVAYHEDIAILTLEEWFVKLANAAMSAAEVIYPEIPSGEALVSQDLPEAALVGAEAVLAKAVDAYLADPRRPIGEGVWQMTPEEYQRRLAAGEVGGRTVVIDHSLDTERPNRVEG